MKKKDDRKTLILLDSHAILHRAYHALPEFASSKGEATGALYGLSTMLLKIITDLKPDYIVACFDLPGPTFRNVAYDGYKAQRKELVTDLVTQINRSRDVFSAFSIPIYEHAGFEADDMLGTIVEQVKKDKNLRTIIASGDMDTLQLVDGDKVLVYTLKKGINDTILYDEKAVVDRFGFTPDLLPDYKGLRGDPSDNIIGIAGIGEKTASILIQTFGPIEKIYTQLKKNPEKFKEIKITERIQGLLTEGEEEAQFSKMLATIRRDAPITFNLPPQTWRETLHVQTIKALFTELDFRTLGSRLDFVLTGEKISETVKQEALLSSEHVDQQELELVTLALWVLDSNITNPTLEDVLQFAKVDTFAKARDIIFAELKKRKLEYIYEEIEKPLIPVIHSMETWGVKIDKSYLSTLATDYHKTFTTLEKKIWELAGVEFNINSPKQMGEVLFTTMGLGVKNQRKTATGQKSTKESELEKMKDSHPIISFILEYRELQKLLSTYIDNIPTMLDKDNRLHTSLRQTGSTTGRMSSTNPNIQNIPIKTELGRNIRKAFTVEKGFTFMSFDYSQIELRVAAILSGDTRLVEIFKDSEDVHAAVASEVFGVFQDKVDKEMRRKAKVINFGILYGMGVNALRSNLGGTREEAQTFYAEYFKRFAGLAQYLDSIKAEAERNGYTETLFGRRRYFEGINSKIPFIKASAERMAINAPFQGTAADLIKLSMKEVFAWIQKEKLETDVRLLLQVHDELVFEVKDELVERAGKEVKKIMENVLPANLSKGVPIIANASAGPNWNETKVLS